MRSKSRPEAPPIGGFTEIAGRRLFLHRSGIGSPAVVFLAGGGAVGLDYLNVQQRAAKLTTSVLYDRGGTGWSDAIRLPHTSAQVTDELRLLLCTAGVPGPYIFVGHSLGGLYARHYALRFPAEVAGLVLLDPAHEDYNAFMPRQLNELRKIPAPGSAEKPRPRLLDRVVPAALGNPLTRSLLARLPVLRRYRALYRELFTEALADWPADIRQSLIDRHLGLDWLRATILEIQNVDELYAEVSRSGAMPNVPTIILSSTGIDGFKRAVSSGEPDALLQQEIEGKQRLYAKLAASVADGQCRSVESGHASIHFRQPEAVLDAIKSLLGTPAS